MLFEGPCAGAGLSQWFLRSEQVCDMLRRVELHVIGQSTERRLVHALQDMVLGRREALRRDLSAPANRAAQLVLDKVELVPNRERGDEQAADALDACLSVSYRKATMWEDVLEAAHALVLATPERRGQRRTVVVFQFGLYALAGGWLRANNTRLSALRLSEWLKSGVAAEAERKGVLLIWRPPAAVNHTQPLLASFEEPWHANAVLSKFYKTRRWPWRRRTASARSTCSRRCARAPACAAC